MTSGDQTHSEGFETRLINGLDPEAKKMKKTLPTKPAVTRSGMVSGDCQRQEVDGILRKFMIDDIIADALAKAQNCKDDRVEAETPRDGKQDLARDWKEKSENVMGVGKKEDMKHEYVPSDKPCERKPRTTPSIVKIDNASILDEIFNKAGMNRKLETSVKKTLPTSGDFKYRKLVEEEKWEDQTNTENSGPSISYFDEILKKLEDTVIWDLDEIEKQKLVEQNKKTENSPTSVSFVDQMLNKLEDTVIWDLDEKENRKLVEQNKWQDNNKTKNSPTSVSYVDQMLLKLENTVICI